MKRCALIALSLVLTACAEVTPPLGSADGSSGDASSADVSSDVSDASYAGLVGAPVGGAAGGVGGAATTGDGSSSSEGGASAACAGESVPPSTLACTGLYTDIVAKTLAPGVRSYTPAVPLWADGAEKARWIALPPGTQIDVTNPSEWTFPVGTKVWKEFSKYGKRVETRLFQKVSAGPPPYWVHTTYAWNADESAAITSGGGDITLEPDGGTYHIPTFAECEECHNGRTDHILGFEQVSLGLAGAAGLTLAELVSEGLVTPAPSQTTLTIGDDGTGADAPALAWLHINCGVTCHNTNSNSTAYQAGMHLRLDPALLDGRQVTISTFDPLSTTIGVPAVSAAWVEPVQWTRIVPGDPTDSLLVQLISNRGTDNVVGGQMPPIASLVVDTADVANVVAWVSKMPGAPGSDAGADGGLDASVAPDADTDATDTDATTGD
jgi:hypothetical protein